MTAARERSKDDYRRDVTQAWQTVRVYIQTKNDKRMPSLQSLIDGTEPRKERQSVSQLKSAVMALSREYGLPVRKAVKVG